MRITIDIADTFAGAAHAQVQTSGQETVTSAGTDQTAAGGLPGIRQFDGGADGGTLTPGKAAVAPTSTREAGAARDGGHAPSMGETTTGAPIPVQIAASTGSDARH
jgi:hypothetical protein